MQPLLPKQRELQTSSQGRVSHRSGGRWTTGHVLLMSHHELLVNVAESIIVLNCSVGTKWIPTFRHHKGQQLVVGDGLSHLPAHLQRHPPMAGAGLLHCQRPPATRSRGQTKACACDRLPEGTERGAPHPATEGTSAQPKTDSSGG